MTVAYVFCPFPIVCMCLPEMGMVRRAVQPLTRAMKATESWIHCVYGLWTMLHAQHYMMYTCALLLLLHIRAAFAQI